MRSLRLIVTRSRGTLPALLLATLTPAAGACGAKTGFYDYTGGGGAGASGLGGSGAEGGFGGSGAEGGFGAFGGGGQAGAGGAPICDPGQAQDTFEVTIPDPGVPADPGTICSVMMQPVASNQAARVTLTKFSMSLHLAQGFVEIPAALDGQILGVPVIEAIAAPNYPQLLDMQVTNVTPVAGGFTFDAEWPAPLQVPPDFWAELEVRTTFTIPCGAVGDSRVVESITFIHLCQEEDDVAWVSSGDECNTCSIIAEMAPSPIVPDKAEDGLPLARAVRLRLVPLARIGRAVVLLAENDGGDGAEYEWDASAGELQRLAPDVVLWRLPEGRGSQRLQAAVLGDEGAAVASFAWEEAA
jgi:hypothetical protein